MNTRTENQLEFGFVKPESSTVNLNSNIYTTKDKSILLSECINYSNLSFLNKQNKIVGKLDWSDGIMKFTGDADESGKVFFENMIKHYIKPYINQNTSTGWKS